MVIRRLIPFAVLLSLLIGPYSCKKSEKEEKPQCSWDSKEKGHCLLKSKEIVFYEYKGDTLFYIHSGYSPSYYHYEDRKLKTFYPPIGLKYAPYTNYEYNACDQLIRSISGNSRNPSYEELADYFYDQSGLLLRINYSFKGLTATSKNGFTVYKNSSTLRSSYRYDSLNILQSSDSIVLDAQGRIIESWQLTYSPGWINASGYIPVQPTMDLSVPKVGDKCVYRSNEITQFTEVTDSVFYNKSDMDTLFYRSRFDPGNNFLGILRESKGYTDCK